MSMVNGRDKDRVGGGPNHHGRSWNEHRVQQHLDWSDQQRRILTDHGNAELWYSPERGYPFTNDELPHYHLQNEQQQETTREIFLQWKLQQQTNPVANPIVGIWERTLFYGGFEYTTHHNEYTYNVQTSTLFIDLRIPKSRNEILTRRSPPIQSLHDMTMEELRYYARQHVFAGYTKVKCMETTATSFPYCATRYHCMDWNYVGWPRSRPNKWYIELPAKQGTDNNNNNNNEANATISQWKEWAYATNQYQQHYYCEHWQRHHDDFYGHDQNQNIFVILRKCSHPDGIIIVWNDHLMYCVDRCGDPSNLPPRGQSSSLVEVVDELLLQRHDITSARHYLSMQGGHGRWIPPPPTTSDHPDSLNNVHRGAWVMDHCIEFWKEGQSFFGVDDSILIRSDGTIRWKKAPSSHPGTNPTDSETLWSIFDTNLDTLAAVGSLLRNGPNHSHRTCDDMWPTRSGHDSRL